MTVANSALDGLTGSWLSDRRGVVYVEFLISFIPLFVLFLGLCQLALAGAAKIVVQHAANAAVRSAIVVLEDEPERYGGLERGSLAEGNQRSSNAVPGWLAFLKGDSAGSSGSDKLSRIQTIRRVAYMPLATLAPSARLAAGSSNLRGVFDASALGRVAVGLLLYNPGLAAVTFRTEPGSDGVIRDKIEPNALVTVHVTYLYACLVPIASRIMCRPGYDLAGYGRVVDKLRRLIESPGDPRTLLRRLRALRREAEQRGEEFERLARDLQRVEKPELQLPWLLSSARFMPLEGEASLPNQGAKYYR